MNSSTPTAKQERRELWLFLLFALLILGAGIGLRDPWPADEPRFAMSAMQMVESGNWLIPHRGSETVFRQAARVHGNAGGRVRD